MSDLISEVKAALQAATPGPWTTWERSDGIQVVETDGELSICDMDGGTWQQWIDNAHLIANSPTWLQQLIDRLETAERQREEAVKALEWANRIIGSGLDVGAELRYEPREWLMECHYTLKRIKGETPAGGHLSTE